MNHRAIAAMMGKLAPVVRDYVSSALAPFAERLSVLEKREPAKADPGRDGVDGKDGAPGERGVDGNDGGVGLDGERGEKGEPGLDGKDGAPGERGEKGDAGLDGKDGALGRDGKDADSNLIARMVTDAVAALPPAKDGDPGRDGKDAHPITRDQIVDALRSFSVDIAEVVQAIAVKHLLENPPKDGASGERGERGDKGDPGRDGRDGLPGVPGLSGEKGLDGTNGRDGKDGLGIDEQDDEFEDDGRVMVRRYYRNGEAVKEKRFITATTIYRGVWKEDWRPEGYRCGDEVTFASAKWIALRDTKEKPETSKDWQLASKAARHGKSAYDVARANGFRGSETEWLATLKGDPGDRGEKGDVGPRGYGG